MLGHIGQVVVLFTLYSQIKHFTGGHVFTEAMPMPTNTAQLVQQQPIQQNGYWGWEGDRARMANYQNYQNYQQQQQPMIYGNPKFNQNSKIIYSRIPSNKNVNTGQGNSVAHSPYTIPPTRSPQRLSVFIRTPRPRVRLQEVISVNGNDCAPGVAC